MAKELFYILTAAQVQILATYGIIVPFDNEKQKYVTNDIDDLIDRALLAMTADQEFTDQEEADLNTISDNINWAYWSSEIGWLQNQ